jgi:hypothetical protein
MSVTDKIALLLKQIPIGYKVKRIQLSKEYLIEAKSNYPNLEIVCYNEEGEDINIILEANGKA